MPNINDYLEWRGDIEISKDHPFNEIDSMILARFSYLIFDKIQMKEKQTIEEISNKMKDFPNEDFLYNGDKEMITNLGKASRFNKMIVTDFVNNSDEKTEKQFGAITIHNAIKECYVSFIGTDSTINGWKEDFNMAFMNTVPCQVSGKEYLEKIAKKYPFEKIRIGGHSKGGNVAIYSAIACSKNTQNRIIKVYNYDGPGFNKEITEKYYNDSIYSKIQTYIPQDSIIGRLMTHKEKMTIVLSVEKGILQHDIFSWQVKRDDLVKVDKNTDNSEDIDKTITDWLEITTENQRRVFVEAIFELFYSTDANTFGEMSKNLSSNLPKILKKYKEISKEDKEIVSEMIKLMVKNYYNIVKDRQYLKLHEMKEEYVHKSKLKIKEIENKYFSKFVK